MSVPDWFVEGATVIITQNFSAHKFSIGDVTALGVAFSPRNFYRSGKSNSNGDPIDGYWLSHDDCKPLTAPKLSLEDILGG